MKLRIPQKEHVVGTVEKMATINILYTEIRVIMQFHCGNRGLITVILLEGKENWETNEYR